MPEDNTEQTGQEAVVETTPANTPENADTDLDDAAESVEETADAPESEEEGESDETPGESEVEKPKVTEESDEFTDLDADQSLTADKIDKLRIKPEDKEQLKQTVTELSTAKGKLAEIGDDFGVETFAPLAKVLTKATATDEELSEVMGKLVKANGAVTMQVLTGGAHFILSNPQFADPLLKALWGEQATVKNIKTLLSYEASGYIDHELGAAYLHDGVQDSDAFQQLNDRLEKAEADRAELQAIMRDPAKLQEIAQGQVGLNGKGTKAAEAFKSDLVAGIPTKLKPFFAKVHWSPEGAHAKLAVEIMNARLEKATQFTETEKYLKQTGIYLEGETRVGMAGANLNILLNLAASQGWALVKELQSDFRGISENSRNAKLAQEKQVKADAKKAETEVKPPKFPVKEQTLAEKEAAIDAKFKATVAAIKGREAVTV